MTTDTPAPLPQVHGAHPPAARRYAGPLPSYRLLRYRLRPLAITRVELEATTTFAQLQEVAKQHYRRLARRYHPDALRSTHHPQIRTGARFQRMTRTYRWLCTFPGQALVPRAASCCAWIFPTPPSHTCGLTWAQTPHPWALPAGFQMLPHWSME